jgi:ribose transport system ATP-binding protein
LLTAQTSAPTPSNQFSKRARIWGPFFIERAVTHFLQVENVSKSFGGVKALRHVNLNVSCGEVHAVAGENGAGKSTLMKILTGVYQPDGGGKILINGEPVDEIAGTSHARALGISIIYQELSVVDNLSISDNIFLSQEISNSIGILNRKAMYEVTERLMKSLDMSLDPRTVVGRLSVGQKQMVEIAKALSYKSKVIIMDEPTASLSHHEATVLKETIRKLRAEGIGVIYITHRLEEIFDLADHVTVLRDGVCIGSYPIAEINRAKLVKLMVDREHDDLYGDYVCHTTETVAMEVTGLTLRNRTPHTPAVRDCSFKVHRGEILGFFGLIGAGRTELMEIIFGLREYTGAIQIGGREVRINHPRAAIKNGIGFVTEDRKAGGLVLGMNIRENFSLTHLETYSTASVMDRSDESDQCSKFVARLGIKASSMEQPVRELSGGNQQKIVISKWVARSPTILIVDEPTRGIDIAAKADVHRLLGDLAKQGMAIIVVSSDLPEVLAVSDRVIVVRDGTIVKELPRALANQQTLMDAATT